MKFIPIFLLFGGYTLIYAAVAAGGKFATEPWAGLFADAYTETQSSTDKVLATPGNPNWQPPNPVVPRLNRHGIPLGPPQGGRAAALNG